MQVPSVDGVVRVFGYVPPSPATNNLMTAVGFKESDLMADINSALWQGAMLLVLCHHCRGDAHLDRRPSVHRSPDPIAGRGRAALAGGPSLGASAGS